MLLEVCSFLKIFLQEVRSQQTFVGLEDVLKTFSTRLQRNNFKSSKTPWRRFKDVLKTSCKTCCLKTSWKTKNCYAEDVLKTCFEDVLKTCLEDFLKTCLEYVLKTYLEDLLKILWRQTKYLLGIPVYLCRDNKSKCVSNKSVFHKSLSDNSKANPKYIK